MGEPLRIPTWYYQQFDADPKLDVPGEGYGGWKKQTLEFSREHTAVVVMHAWDAGSPEEFPGWFRAVEYLPRSRVICRRVFPTLLGAVRAAGLPLFHVVGGGDYYRDFPGYKRAVSLAQAEPTAPEQIPPDPALEKLQTFRFENVFYGRHNADDIKRGFEQVGFPPEARPQGDEGIAETGNQLFALCREKGVNHLVYTGFAINWCLLLSPGGMFDMQGRGFLCSTIREATTAVENKETARYELAKQVGLWRVALAFGFVFDLQDFIPAIGE